MRRRGENWWESEAADGCIPHPISVDTVLLDGVHRNRVRHSGRFFIRKQVRSRARRSPRMSRGRYPNCRWRMSTCCRRARISRSLSSGVRRPISDAMEERSRRTRCQNMIRGSWLGVAKSIRRKSRVRGQNANADSLGGPTPVISRHPHRRQHCRDRGDRHQALAPRAASPILHSPSSRQSRP